MSPNLVTSIIVIIYMAMGITLLYCAWRMAKKKKTKRPRLRIVRDRDDA